MMSTSHYTRVVEAFCTCIGRSESFPTLLKSGEIVVDGVAFSISKATVGETESAVIICDFGDIPDHTQSIVQREMLESNAYLFHGPGAPCFAMSPETGRAIFMLHMVLEEATGESLRDCLSYFAAVAREWQSRDWQTEAADRLRMRVMLNEMVRGV